MNKLSILAASSALFFAACGGSSVTNSDDVSSSNSTANETDFSAEADYSVEAYESLPLCNDKKEGQTGYVTGTSKLYVCEDGEWVVTQKPSSPSASTDDWPGANVGGYDPSTGILTDGRDGQKYKTTKIGEQVWMAENLNYAYLQPTVELDSSSFCYDNDPAMCKKYGRLYLWSAAMDSAGVLKNVGKGKGCGYGVECGVEDPIQGICPKGWHLPSRVEFEILLKNVGITNAKDGISQNLRANVWENGSDKYGFSALPAGRKPSDKSFDELGTHTYFWSFVGDDVSAYSLYVGNYHASVSGEISNYGYSVRCLQDN